MFPFLLALGCAQPKEKVKMRGQILDGKDQLVGAPDVAIEVRDGRTKRYSSATSDADGMFTAEVPANSVVHLILDGGAYVPTAFSAIVGSDDVTIPVGDLWMRTPGDIDALRDTFENCPTVDEPGGIVEGEVNYNVINAHSEQRLIAEDAVVTVYDKNGNTSTTCYLDNDGESSTDVAVVGASGRFAAFGLQSGPTTIGFEVPIEGIDTENFAFVWLPEEGVGPFYPALIEFP